MDRIFQRLGDKQAVDLVPYLRDQFARHDDIQLYVGSDSQVFKRATVFATVIVLHYGRTGAHVLFSKRKRDHMPGHRVDSRNERLWLEVEDSLEVANFLRDSGFPAPDYVDIDLNPDERYGSNTMLRAAMGYVEANGYDARCKPDAFAASAMADRIVNPKDANSRRMQRRERRRSRKRA